MEWHFNWHGPVWHMQTCYPVFFFPQIKQKLYQIAWSYSNLLVNRIQDFSLALPKSKFPQSQIHTQISTTKPLSPIQTLAGRAIPLSALSLKKYTWPHKSFLCKTWMIMKTRFYICHDGCTCSGSIIIVDIDKNVALHLLDKPHVRSGLRKKMWRHEPKVCGKIQNCIFSHWMEPRCRRCRTTSQQG